MIDIQITRDELNNASVIRKLDPLCKNILQRQNPFELVFKAFSTFERENLINGALLSEIEIGKNNLVDEILEKIPSTQEVKI